MKASKGKNKKEQISSDSIAEMLNVLLADEFVLYLKLRNAHWNVEGIDFKSMHTYFEELYTELATIIDEVAERLRKINHYAPATMKEYLSLTHLKENRNSSYDSKTFLSDILDGYEIIIEYIRTSLKELEDILDPGSEDLLNTTLEQHEKTAWMLRAHLK